MSAKTAGVSRVSGGMRDLTQKPRDLLQQARFTAGHNACTPMAPGDETLKKIAHELVEIVRRDAKTDWSVKEQVRAKLRATIKRLLLRYGYPPDKEEAATQLVLQQAEVIAGEEAA